jgi:aspartate ammonia-lyase
MDKQQNDMNLLLYKRLFFEIKILRESLQHILNDTIQDIQTNKQIIKNLQEKFYIISNNLYQV